MSKHSYSFDKKEKPLNLNFIVDGLKKAVECAKDAKGKEVVLTFGLTGFGKTTLIAYLLGRLMRLTRDSKVDLVNASSDFVIGHGSDAETVFGRAYLVENPTSPGTFLTIADLPGFADTRNAETVVITLSSMEMIIRNASGVKAFLFVLPWYVFLDGRGLLLRELVKSLVLIFKDPVEMASHAILVINRCDEVAAEAKRKLKELIADLVISWEKQAAQESLSSVDGLDCESYSRMAAFGKALTENNKLVFFEPLDGGKSRRAVFELINGVKPRRWFANVRDASISQIKSRLGYCDDKISIADFAFDECNKHRINTNLAVYGRVAEGMDLIKYIQAAATRYLEINSDIPRCQTQIAAWQKLFDNLKEARKNPGKGNTADEIKDLKSLLRKTKISIQSKNSELKEEEVKKQDLVKKLKEVDVDTAEFFDKASMFEYVFWLFFLGYRKKHFVLDSGDRSVEFVDVTEEKKNGEFHDRVDKRKEGYFSATYISERHARPAYFETKVYIKKKDEAGNKKIIQNLRQDISISEEKIKTLKQEIEENERETNNLESNIKKLEYNEKCDEEMMLQRLQECEENIAANSSKISALMEEKDDVRQEGLDTLKAFHAYKPKLDVIVELSELMEFPSDLVKDFVSDYKDFLDHMIQFKDDFEANAECILASNLFTSEGASSCASSVELKDPISGEPIKDPVVSPAGTLFDADSLIKQFDLSQSDIQPFVFRRDDGRTETIPCMSWKKVPSIEAYLQESRRSRSSVEPNKMKMNGCASVSTEELERQREKVVKEIQALEEEIMMKKSLLEKIKFELLKKGRA